MMAGSSSKRSIQERQLNKLRTQLQAYENNVGAQKDNQRSRVNRAPSQIYQLQSLPLPEDNFYQSQSVQQLKIPTKVNSNESRAYSSQSLQQCPLKPQMPSYPSHFGKRNFSTGGDTKVSIQKRGGVKVVNLIGVRQQKSNDSASVKKKPAN